MAARDKTGEGVRPRVDMTRYWEALKGICARQTAGMTLALSHDGCDCSVKRVGRGRREAGQKDVAIIMQHMLEAWPRWCLWKLVQEMLYSGF